MWYLLKKLRKNSKHLIEIINCLGIVTQAAYHQSLTMKTSRKVREFIFFNSTKFRKLNGQDCRKLKGKLIIINKQVTIESKEDRG